MADRIREDPVPETDAITTIRWPSSFAAASAVLAVVAAIPVVQWIADVWSTSALGGAPAAFVTLPICGLLAWLAPRRPEWVDARDEISGATWGLVAVSCSWLGALVWGEQRHEALMLAAICGPPWGLVWLWGTFGARRAAGLSLPILFAWFALPWELFLRDLDEPLQAWSAQIARGVLNVSGYGLELWHETTIYSPGGFYITVDETCSGMNMLVTLSMFALVFGWLTQRVVLNRLILLIAVLPLALVANGARVAIIWLLGHHGDEALAMGPWHTGTAYIVFMPLFAAIYGLGEWLKRWSPPTPPR